MRTKLLLIALAIATSTVGACSSADPVHRGTASRITHRAGVASHGHGFERSPGGTIEVSAEEVLGYSRATGEPSVRIVDVREPEELTSDLGHVEGVEHVPLQDLVHAAESWDPGKPVVLVCRTGRRSARGVEQLEALGFRNVASMTGGMLRWVELGLPVSRDANDVVVRHAIERHEASVDVRVRGAHDAPPLTIDPLSVRYVRTASLLSTGSESCVDGRDAHAVVGTPGGDAGELLVTLAAAESLGAPVTDDRAIETLLDDWIETFGRFYVHTDTHALEHARRQVLEDPRFASRGIAPADVAAMESLARRPPHDLEDAMLDVLLAPPNVGCGHLRSMLLDPEAYGVRPDLPPTVLRAVFRHLWRVPDEIDWVVLEGEHGERAVVVVELEGPIHPYTRVPAIPPSIDGRQTFVLHPQVTAFLREQYASFLLERSPSLARTMSTETLAGRMRSHADRQLEATLARLAAGLPIYEARFRGPTASAR